RAKSNFRAHIPDDVGKRHIALDTVTTRTKNLYGTAADCAKRHEIGRRRRVAFNLIFARRVISGSCRDDEPLPAVLPHLYSKARHHIQRDLNIGPGYQLP